MYSPFKFTERLLASEIAKHSDMHTEFKARILNPAFTVISKTACSWIHASSFRPSEVQLISTKP